MENYHFSNRKSGCQNSEGGASYSKECTEKHFAEPH